jgi:sporulation protein YlmC with PRC-barrel domain
MPDTAQFTIGSEVSCSDGAVGTLSRVIVDPLAEQVTHLVVEPEHRREPGRVQGLVIDRDSCHVTHVLLQEGHLWGRKEVAIPISAVAGTVGGIRLKIAKQQVQDLPPVDHGSP